MLITEDHGAEVSAIPVAKRSPKVSATVRGMCRMLQKDVNLYGTNLRSPLESTKVSKTNLKTVQNELKKRPVNAEKRPNEAKNEPERATF
jgi:hypothetical protein